MAQQFYNAKPDGTGCGCGFSVDAKNRSIYVSFVQQSSWNAAAKTGSFNGEKLNLKFSPSEAGAIIYAIDHLEEWKGFHDTSKGNYADKYTTGISFMPFGPKAPDGTIALATMRFGLSVNKSEKETGKKVAFKVALSKGDAVVVKEYLRFALEHINSQDYSDDKKRRIEAAKAREAAGGQAPDPVPAAEEPAF